VKGKKGRLLQTEVDLAYYAANGTNTPKDFNFTSKSNGPVLSVELTNLPPLVILIDRAYCVG